MFYRRRLPHWHPDLTEAKFLFVTWRLAGSIPRACLPQPATGAPLSAGRAFLVLDREVDKAAFGPVWLRDARVASVVANALLYGEHGRNFYQLRAWVIMPNHVHVLLLPKTSLPVLTRWLKGSTARPTNLILGRTGKAFWQDESFDHGVRDEVELDRIAHYVEYNPVSAGLATKHAPGVGRARGGWQAKAPATQDANLSVNPAISAIVSQLLTVVARSRLRVPSGRAAQGVPDCYEFPRNKWRVMYVCSEKWLFPKSFGSARPFGKRRGSRSIPCARTSCAAF
jgi:hypothetical protein